MMMTSYQWWGYQQGDCEWGDVRGCLRGLGDNSCKRRGLYLSELCNSLDEEGGVLWLERL